MKPIWMILLDLQPESCYAVILQAIAPSVQKQTNKQKNRLYSSER